MKKGVSLKILMVDDHPLILEGYQNTLLSIKKSYQNFKIDLATTCDEAVSFITKAAKKAPYDVLFVDIRIPPTSDGTITSGEDLSKYAREMMPETKIIILTMYNESYRIHNILRNINPQGFLIKSDLTSNELANAFISVLENPPYYSGTVNTFLQKSITSDIYIDDKNRKILYLLSQGVKTKNLAEYVGLSLSAVEKRKKHLKLLFSVQDGGDETLLKEARIKGFL